MLEVFCVGGMCDEVFAAVLRYERPLIRGTVMSEGTVAECGNPVDLLRREESLFKAYMDQNLQINAENAAAMGADEEAQDDVSES